MFECVINEEKFRVPDTYKITDEKLNELLAEVQRKGRILAGWEYGGPDVIMKFKFWKEVENNLLRNLPSNLDGARFEFHIGSYEFYSIPA